MNLLQASWLPIIFVCCSSFWLWQVLLAGTWRQLPTWLGQQTWGWLPANFREQWLIKAATAGYQQSHVEQWLGQGLCWQLLVYPALSWPEVPALGLALVLLLQVWAWRPLLRLKRQANTRRAYAIAALPGLMDSLALLLSAGFPLYTALQRVTSGTETSPLHEEIRAVLARMRTGASLPACMQQINARLPATEIRIFTGLLAQASQQGTALTKLLREQAETRREEAGMRAEKFAQEAPVRLMLPLGLFIFPATMVPLIGIVVAKVMWQV